MLVSIKLYWNTDIFINLYIIYGWFWLTVAEMSSCEEMVWPTCKACILTWS